MKHITLIIALCVCLMGCVTATPAFGGKTRAETSFIDADGTSYTRNVELPAGVDLAGQDGMTYQWGADGSGNIAINQQGSGSTQGQAGLQAEGIAAQAQMFQSVASLVGAVAELAAPLVGSKLNLDAAQKAQETTNDMEIRSALVNRLDALSDKLFESQKADASRMTQLEQRLQALIDSLGGADAGGSP